MKRAPSSFDNPRSQWLDRHPKVDRLIGFFLGYEVKTKYKRPGERQNLADFDTERRLRRIQSIKNAGRKPRRKGGAH